MFQFQCGAIGRSSEVIPRLYIVSFNSSVVRLVVDPGTSSGRVPMFQFQCGAIGRFD